jgi:hypothetical protein
MPEIAQPDGIRISPSSGVLCNVITPNIQFSGVTMTKLFKLEPLLVIITQLALFVNSIFCIFAIFDNPTCNAILHPVNAVTAAENAEYAPVPDSIFRGKIYAFLLRSAHIHKWARFIIHNPSIG